MFTGALSVVLAILSSTGFGSALGWIGGLLNRTVDLKAKQAEYTFELAKRDKDILQTKEEVAGNIAVADRSIEEAKIVSAGAVGVAAYNAMSESYKDQASPLPAKYAWVVAFSKMIRPGVTVIFVVFSLILSIYIVVMAMHSGIVFTPDEWAKWLFYVVQWVFFQAGVVIGWWFANRPSGNNDKPL